MKKIILSIILSMLLICSLLSGEEQDTEFMKLINVLKGESIIKLNWELSIGSSSSKYPYKMKSRLIHDFNLWIEDKPDSNEIIGQIKEFQFIKENSEILLKLFTKFGNIGNGVGMFIYNDGQIPIRVADFSGKPCLLITDIASDKIYNTLRTTMKSRALDILNSIIFQELNDLDRGLKDMDIDQFGMIVSYGSKNFLDEYDISLEGEALCFIVSKDTCSKYVNGEITDKELIDNSHVFISDRDMMFGFKKIDLDM